MTPSATPRHGGRSGGASTRATSASAWFAARHAARRPLRIFTELVDWSDGEDSQATLIVPLPPGDPGPLGDEAAVATQLRLLPEGVHLARIYPKGQSIPPSWTWLQGRAAILPHD